MKFKVGDRVAVYMQVIEGNGGVARRTAFVESQRLSQGQQPCLFVCLDKPVEFIIGDDYSRLWVHEKQCRRLKPKRKAREFWILDNPNFDRPTTYREEPTRTFSEIHPMIVHVCEVIGMGDGK
jgi:hypothetical protein